VDGAVFTVCGARGGLGATTLAVNLAVQVASLTGSPTALVDLDLQRGDVSAFLNLTPLQSVAAIASASGNVDEVFLHGILTRHPSGVFVLPAPQQIEEADLIGHDEVQVALRLLRTQFRYTVVDTSRTITAPTLAALEQAERALIVTDLSVPGVRATHRTFELLGRVGAPRERLELVVTHAVPGPVDVKDAARIIGKEPFFVIPRDEAASGAMNAGMPLNGASEAGLGRAVAELAGKLTGVPTASKRRGRFLGRFLHKEARAWD
jgi:pilus assembly protein CpaE